MTRGQNYRIREGYGDLDFLSRKFSRTTGPDIDSTHHSTAYGEA